MDPEKQDEDEALVQAQDQDLDSDPGPDSDPERDPDSEAEEDVRIFNAWMRRCRGEKTSTTEEESEQEVPERTGSRAERTGSRAERPGSRAERPGSRAERPGSRTERPGSRMSLEPPPRPGRRASLPCPSTLSSMTLSRLHVSTATPVTAKVLLKRSSSRRLLPSPQEVPPPPGERERRGSLAILHTPPTIPERPAPEPERPAPKPGPESKPRAELSRDKALTEKRGHFRRRNIMSLSDADSVCLICHNELKHGTGGTRELQCSHTFHKECIEEYLWRRQACPTCHVQVSLPKTLLWANVP